MSAFDKWLTLLMLAYALRCLHSRRTFRIRHSAAPASGCAAGLERVAAWFARTLFYDHKQEKPGNGAAAVLNNRLPAICRLLPIHATVPRAINCGLQLAAARRLGIE
jgi:hypothetical protein